MSRGTLRIVAARTNSNESYMYVHHDTCGIRCCQDETSLECLQAVLQKPKRIDQEQMPVFHYEYKRSLDGPSPEGEEEEERNLINRS